MNKPAPADLFDIAEVAGTASKEEAREFAAYPEIRQLKLNVFSGWDGDLEKIIQAFEGIPVKALAVFGVAGIDITPLKAFESLQYLHVAGLVHGQLDLDDFPQLRSFGLGFEIKGPKAKVVKLSWGSCKNLETTGSTGAKMPPIELLYEFPKLCSLGVVKPSWAPEQLRGLSKLREINFSYWWELRSLDQLSGCNSIERLQLANASNLSDYSALAQMINLKRLVLWKCPVFPDVKLIAGLKNLEEFLLIDTKLANGNVELLKHLPKLKDFSLVDQKHLIPSRDELDAFFEQKKIGAGRNN